MNVPVVHAVMAPCAWMVSINTHAHVLLVIQEMGVIQVSKDCENMCHNVLRLCCLLKVHD